MKLAGWGRYPVTDCTVTAPRTPDALAEARKSGPLIARGNGRAYGDSALNEDNTVSMRHFNRMLAFEDSTAGLASAKDAGMPSVGLGGATGSAVSIGDYTGVTRLPGAGIRLDFGA